MSEVIIYVSLNRKGRLEYRDSEGHKGEHIVTHAKHDCKIVWKLDKCSRISEITGIKLKGDLSILNGKPRKVDFNQWEVYASDKEEGELTYAIEFEMCKDINELNDENQQLKDPDLPLLRIP
jgi:hypothetical protein